MSEESGFQGFSKETIAFFRGLKRNNNRQWFESHHEVYKDCVLEPAKAFVVALGRRLKEISPHIVAVPKINKSIFRLNRDTRFSYDVFHPNARLLLHNGLHAGLEITISDVLFSPGLADYCFEKFKHCGPLHRWFSALMSRSAPPPPKFRF